MFSKISSLENLLVSYYLARRGKRKKPQICRFDFFLENNLVRLKYLLISGNYLPSPYTHFTIHDPKTRQVAAPAFQDRILQHSLVSVIEPLFEKRFIFDSYACRKGKGTHFGARRVKKFLMAARCLYGEDKEVYVLQCDIQKFFQSISWDILLSLIGRVIKCPQALTLIERIITTHEKAGEAKKNSNQHLSTDEVPAVSIKQRKGLPIGNLTSQLFANIYLNELDHFIKEGLRERWYGRYMDDFLIIHPDKEHLKIIRERIRNFLKKRLDLDLHPRKVIIRNVKEGVPFVGYRIFFDHILIRGKTLQRMRKRLKFRIKAFQKGKIDAEDLQATRSSFEGHLKHAQTWHLKNKLFPPIGN